MIPIRTAVFALLATSALAGTSAFAAAGDTTLKATLTGAAETAAADPDGSGTFIGRVNPDTGQLCYTLTSVKLAGATMAHIHVGGVGVAGPVAVALSPDVPTENCIAVDKAVAAKLVASPGDYYVNIHTATFPKGAIRGQLMK